MSCRFALFIQFLTHYYHYRYRYRCRYRYRYCYCYCPLFFHKIRSIDVNKARVENIFTNKCQLSGLCVQKITTARE